MEIKDVDIRSLLSAYDKRNILDIKKVSFKGVEGRDVYNITAPFYSNGDEYIAGRVEPRENEVESRIMFFVKKDDIWILDKTSPVFHMQDPFVCIINDELIFGGVEITLEHDAINYSTVFFRGKDIHNLERFAKGPCGMKDIRLILLPQDNIGVFTRPQGVIGGKGRIGFMDIASIDDLSRLEDKDYFAAPLLKDDFHYDEWLGVNAVYILKNGLVGVLGHIACCTEDAEKKSCKNYYPITFVLDIRTNTSIGMKIIAIRDDFPVGEAKDKTLRNVLFPGGIVRHDDGTATMYVGASEAESYEVKLIDPFLEYEK